MSEPINEKDQPAPVPSPVPESVAEAVPAPMRVALPEDSLNGDGGQSSGNPTRLIWFVLFVIVVDQTAKWLVLKNMYRHQSIDLLGDWLKLTFTENPGMAFGIEYGYPGMITIISIIATVLILVYTVKVEHLYRPYSLSLAFVLGGALGNIIDRVFYGMILYDQPIFLGKVVDFIHVNVWRGTVADGVPFLGGKFVALFPIWNVADMAIVLGVVGILFFQKKFHEKADEQHEGGESTDSTTLPSQPE